jgi:hypothetical protein
MIIKRLTKAVSITGAAMLLMVANASAGTITYTTNATGTEFVAYNDVAGLFGDQLVSSDGASTLTFTPNVISTTGTPSGLDLGDFELTCIGCSPTTTVFNPFVFDLVVSDSTDGATGMFIGTSSGGTVSSDSDTIVIVWTTATPGSLQLGPGTFNVLSGNFGTTEFNKIVAPTTVLAAPNSGTPPGDTTVQGQITSNLPEPTTSSLIAGGLLVLGLFGRKKLRRS